MNIKDKVKIGMNGRDAYGDILAELGDINEDIVVLAADALSSTRGNIFGDKYPERTFNFGIAEANMVSAAAGMALAKKIPVVGAYGFLLSMRACEMVRTDICYTNSNVKLVATATGLAMGPAGSTHQCLEDIAIMRSFPNMTIVSPASALETARATYEIIQNYEGPVYFRLERNNFFEDVEEIFLKNDYPFELGKGITIKEGNDITLVGTGRVLALAIKAADKLKEMGINARVINMHTIKPLDTDIIEKAVEETAGIITIEEHNIIGGLGEAVSSAAGECSNPVRVKRFGVQDEFCAVATAEEIWENQGMTVDNIIKNANNIVSK